MLHITLILYSFILLRVESLQSYARRKRYVIKSAALRCFTPQISSNVFSVEVDLDIHQHIFSPHSREHYEPQVGRIGSITDSSCVHTH